MTYQIEKPEGAPEWFTPGIKCKVKYRKMEDWAGPYTIVWFLTDSHQGFLDDSGTWWDEAEPLEPWQPQPGEYCAFWNNDWEAFIIDEFTKQSNGRYANKHAGSFRYIARITGIDCACSLDDLKARTDWY